MTTSPQLQQNFATDTWVKATWDEFMVLAYDPAYETGKAYYNRGKARIEMTPLAGITVRIILLSRPWALFFVPLKEFRLEN